MPQWERAYTQHVTLVSGLPEATIQRALDMQRAMHPMTYPPVITAENYLTTHITLSAGPITPTNVDEEISWLLEWAHRP